MSTNNELFTKEVLKHWKKLADPKARKKLKDKDIKEILEFVLDKYQSNPDDKNFKGELITFVNNRIDRDLS